jgi:hypothetical protein
MMPPPPPPLPKNSGAGSGSGTGTGSAGGGKGVTPMTPASLMNLGQQSGGGGNQQLSINTNVTSSGRNVAGASSAPNSATTGEAPKRQAAIKASQMVKPVGRKSSMTMASPVLAPAIGGMNNSAGSAGTGMGTGKKVKIAPASSGAGAGAAGKRNLGLRPGGVGVRAGECL